MAVKIVSKDGNVVITADDGSKVSDITVDGDDIVPKEIKYKCVCLGCKWIIPGLLVATMLIAAAALIMIFATLK